MSENGHINCNCAKQCDEQKKPEVKTIVSFEVTEGIGGQVRINSTNEAFLALAVRRINQVVDLFLAQEEQKRIEKANTIVTATVQDNLRNRIIS